MVFVGFLLSATVAAGQAVSPSGQSELADDRCAVMAALIQHVAKTTLTLDRQREDRLKLAAAAYRRARDGDTKDQFIAARAPETEPDKALRFEALRAREWTTPTASKDEDWICYMLAYAATGWTRLSTARDRKALAQVVLGLAEKVGDILDASDAAPTVEAAPPAIFTPQLRPRADIDG